MSETLKSFQSLLLDVMYTHIWCLPTHTHTHSLTHSDFRIKSPLKSHSLSPLYPIASEVTSEAPIKVAQPLTSLSLSLRDNFRSPHQSRTASHLSTPQSVR